MLLPLLVACVDYDLDANVDKPVEGQPEDSGEPAEDTAADTADSAEDTGGSTVPDDTAPVATEPVYINTSSTLYSYDPGSNRATEIADFNENGRAFSGMTDIAIDLDGHMFGGSYTALYRIDPNTAEVTFVADLSDEMTGLTFVSDGTLVGAGAGVNIVDPNTGRLTELVPPGRFDTSGDIVGLPDGMLYWTVTGGDDLVVVDPSSGSAQRVGDVGESGVYGLGYAYGTLYGFTSAGRVLQIDSATGRVSDDTRATGTWWGATTNPVLW